MKFTDRDPGEVFSDFIRTYSWEWESVPANEDMEKILRSLCRRIRGLLFLFRPLLNRVWYHTVKRMIKILLEDQGERKKRKQKVYGLSRDDQFDEVWNACAKPAFLHGKPKDLERVFTQRLGKLLGRFPQAKDFIKVKLNKEYLRKLQNQLIQIHVCLEIFKLSFGFAPPPLFHEAVQNLQTDLSLQKPENMETGSQELSLRLEKIVKWITSPIVEKARRWFKPPLVTSLG